MRGRGHVPAFDCVKGHRMHPDVFVSSARVAPEDRDSLYVTFHDVLNSLAALPNADVYRRAHGRALSLRFAPRTLGLRASVRGSSMSSASSMSSTDRGAGESFPRGTAGHRRSRHRDAIDEIGHLRVPRRREGSSPTRRLCRLRRPAAAAARPIFRLRFGGVWVYFHVANRKLAKLRIGN